MQVRVMPWCGWMVVCAALAGCSISTGTVLESTGVRVVETKAEVAPAQWPYLNAAVGLFERNELKSKAYVTVTGPGGTAGGVGLESGSSARVPMFVVRTLEDAGLFKSFSAYPLPTSQLLVEISMNSRYDIPWWNWVQLIDIWTHTLFFPTLGADAVTDVEISVYDLDHTLLRRWSYHHAHTYIAWIWFFIEEGGMGPMSESALPDALQEEAFRAAVQDLVKGLK